MAARMFTWGWDLFAPPETVVYHLWSRGHRPSFRQVLVFRVWAFGKLGKFEFVKHRSSGVGPHARAHACFAISISIFKYLHKHVLLLEGSGKSAGSLSSTGTPSNDDSNSSNNNNPHALSRRERVGRSPRGRPSWKKRGRRADSAGCCLDPAPLWPPAPAATPTPTTRTQACRRREKSPGGSRGGRRTNITAISLALVRKNYHHTRHWNETSGRWHCFCFSGLCRVWCRVTWCQIRRYRQPAPSKGWATIPRLSTRQRLR